nr:MAG TPA: hypothetical protein [Caudoviricetes sp.]
MRVFLPAATGATRRGPAFSRSTATTLARCRMTTLACAPLYPHVRY